MTHITSAYTLFPFFFVFSPSGFLIGLAAALRCARPCTTLALQMTRSNCVRLRAHVRKHMESEGYDKQRFAATENGTVKHI